MRKSAWIFLVFALAGNLFSQQEVSRAGTSGAPFLKLGVGARACAMGETMVAVRNEVADLFWNPAGIASFERRALTVSRNEMYVNLSYNFLGIIFPIAQSSAIGVSVLYFDSGEMEVTTVDLPEGSGEFFNWQSYCIGMSYGRLLTDRLSLGGSIKYIREGSYHEKAHTIAFDVGALLDTGILGFRLGLCMSNIGENMRFSSPSAPERSNGYSGIEDNLSYKYQLQTQSYPLPLTFRMGLAVDLLGKSSEFIQQEKNRVTLAIDANDPNDAFLRSNFGIEYEWNSLLSLRGGYRGLAIERDPMKDYSTSSYAFGAGIKYDLKTVQFQFDYAFADYRVLGSAHHFTLGIFF